MTQPQTHSSTPVIDPASFIGTWRRFGVVGPVYEIIGQDKALENGDWMMRVRRRHRRYPFHLRLQSRSGQPLHEQLREFANLFAAITSLEALPWLPASVRDIGAFRVEQWSDFTKLVKS